MKKKYRLLISITVLITLLIVGMACTKKAKTIIWGGGTNQDVKRPKSGKLHRSEAARLDFARHGGENMSVGDLTNYIRNIGEAGGDTSQFDAQLARAKERANSKQRDDKTAALINYIKDASADPRKRKSLFDKIKEDIAKKNYKK